MLDFLPPTSAQSIAESTLSECVNVLKSKTYKAINNDNDEVLESYVSFSSVETEKPCSEYDFKGTKGTFLLYNRGVNFTKSDVKEKMSQLIYKYSLVLLKWNICEYGAYGGNYKSKLGKPGTFELLEEVSDTPRHMDAYFFEASDRLVPFWDELCEFLDTLTIRSETLLEDKEKERKRVEKERIEKEMEFNRIKEMFA
jgi:hypothetical protein